MTESSTSTTPSVLFVCVKNGGKSQMAAALMRHHAGQTIEVHSAGTTPGTSLNALSAEAIAEVGADMTHDSPKPIDPDLLAHVDRVIVLGTDAHVEPVAGMRAPIETWKTDEPSERGIDGIERMRLVRDDIDDHIRTLMTELLKNS
ncbi:arsenate-mycothiol transferase [Brevibacterium sandarakinum]|uniref:Arsenate-mycothiol transferase n=1 Tax=Brevibacterium sandarakinum TaxID=629680 RepID=A0A1H1NHY1_BRESA|nr:low molecular weight phosphatase family protein [Brevibacterium sandarakinum]SDR98355.1 arsenate-mycothiol transferase [Brevibacterium sandarakinum]SDS34024.1 arsenate-mycothiol transferase [Brevibacterium sandarakinum]